jgi:hypothetical protein
MTPFRAKHPPKIKVDVKYKINFIEFEDREERKETNVVWY